MSRRRGPIRRPGPRYPSGKLKPPEPNEKVLALRRFLLGAKEGERANIRQAENPLDLALARGWLTERQHFTAEIYAGLVKSIYGDLPTMRTSCALTSTLNAAVEWTDEGSSTLRSGVNLPADHELARAQHLLDVGQITRRQFTLAEKAHRRARINWSTVPSEELVKIWDSMLEIGVRHNPPRDHATKGELKSADRLRRVQAAMTPEERRAVFDFCVLREWPQWIVLGVSETPLPREQGRKRRLLQTALDKACDALGNHPSGANRDHRNGDTVGVHLWHWKPPEAEDAA